MNSESTGAESHRRRLISNVSKVLKSIQSKPQSTKTFAHNRIKSQPTNDSINSLKLQLHKRQVHTPQQQKITIQILPTMNDDFRERKTLYKENFILKNRRIIKLEFSESQKFCYITLYDTKCDLHYKLRLTNQTGHYIMNKMKGEDRRFRDYIFKDDRGRYYIQIAFDKLDRKYQFSKYLPSCFKEDCEEFDPYLRQQIAKLDRTELLMFKFKQPFY